MVFLGILIICVSFEAAPPRLQAEQQIKEDLKAKIKSKKASAAAVGEPKPASPALLGEALAEPQQQKQQLPGNPVAASQPAMLDEVEGLGENAVALPPNAGDITSTTSKQEIWELLYNR